MSTATSHTVAQPLCTQINPEPQLLEQRLEAIDQALVGLLPRHERLAAVAHVESRVRELATTSSASIDVSHEPPRALPLTDPTGSHPASGTPGFSHHSQYFAVAPGGWAPATQKKKRSRLAVTAGVLGIISLALVFATPVTYFMVMLLGEVLGEIVAYVLIGAHVLAITTAGVAAVGLGSVALLNLWRRKGELAGHGWAITGLCTGPLPVLIGCSAVLLVAAELGAFEYFTTTTAVASSDNSSSSKSSLAELKEEIEKLRQEIRSEGHIYPTASQVDALQPDAVEQQLGRIYYTSPGGAPACAPPACAPSSNSTRSPSSIPASCAPACAAPFAAQDVPQPSVQPAAHVALPAATQPPAPNSSGFILPQSAAPANSPPVDLLPPATPPRAPQAAPRPDAPAEPAEMPESAPVIYR